MSTTGPRRKCSRCNVLWNGDPECWCCDVSVEDQVVLPTIDGSVHAAYIAGGLIPGQEWA